MEAKRISPIVIQNNPSPDAGLHRDHHNSTSRRCFHTLCILLKNPDVVHNYIELIRRPPSRAPFTYITCPDAQMHSDQIIKT